MSERTQKLDELLREEISLVIRREVDDPRIGFVTITDVEVSTDLRHADVWVSALGSSEEKKQSLRRFRDDVREVATGFECGIGLDGFNEVEEGDIIECFSKQMVSRIATA